MKEVQNADIAFFNLLAKIKQGITREEAFSLCNDYLTASASFDFGAYRFADIWILFQDEVLRFEHSYDVDLHSIPLNDCEQRTCRNADIHLRFADHVPQESHEIAFAQFDALNSFLIIHFDLLADDAIFGNTLSKLPAQVYRITRENDQYKLSFCSGLLFDSGVANEASVGMPLRDFMRNQLFTSVYQKVARVFMGETVEFEVMHSKSWFHHTINAFHTDEQGYIVEVIGFAQDITDRHMAQHQLELREAELSQAQEIAKIGNWYWNKESDYIEWPQSIDRIFGFLEDRRPKSLNEFHELFEERSQKRINKAHQLIANRSGIYEEEVIFNKDGVQRMLLVNGKAILNDQKRVLGISGTVRDITDIKTIEESLRISERRLNAAIKGANTGIWEKNLTGDVIFLNALSKEILGLTSVQNEVEVRELLKQVHPQDQEKLSNIFSNDTEENFRYTFRFYKHDRLHFIEISASLYNAKFLDKAKFIGILTDITERKLTEIKIKEVNAQLKGILDNSSSAIFIKEATGLILLMNKTGEKWWKVTDDAIFYTSDILGEHAFQLSQVADAEVLKTLSAYTYEVEDYIDGRKSNLLMTKFPIDYGNGQVFIGGIATDITQLKENEHELILAKEKAEESDRLKSAFLANMSHEIRTPLNSIIGFSDLLKKRQLQEDDRNRFLNIINEQGRHLLSIVNDIIDLSAIESNQLKLKFAEVDLNSSLSNLRRSFEEEVNELAQKNVEIVLSTPDGKSPLVKVDSLRINQILKNLIGNAIKFTEKGFVRFGYSLGNGRVDFVVEDTGCGIAKEHLETIFKRFRQVDQSDTRKHGGTGLGLAISKALVELMGGEISVESEVNKGTFFKFWIPATWTIEEGLTTAESTEVSVPDLSGKKIIIVEDDPGSAFLLRSMLLETRAELEHFVLGRDVLKYTREHKNVDLILMDLQLPDISGYECTEIIKKEHPSIRIIVQSAQVMSKDREKAIASGCDGFIPKPLNLRTVFTRIEEVLGD